MTVKNIAPERLIIKCSEDNGKNLRPLGRTVIADDCLCAPWCNSGFSFNFVGKGFIISLGDVTLSEVAYIKITVDNTVYKFAVVNGKEKLIVECLPERRHRVTVLRITEGTVAIKFDTLTIFGDMPRWTSPLNRKTRRIEFLGDSLTCGYGDLAPSTVPDYNTFEEDSTQTYAAFTADAFNAELRTVCLSGKGIICNCNGDRNDYKACDFFKYDDFAGRDHDFTLWQPDVLVINIGTNDSWGGASEEEYISAMHSFAGFVRGVYPDTKIIWVCGMFARYYGEGLEKMVQSLGGEKEGYYILMLDSFCGVKSEVGGGGHPNVNANIRFAKALVKKVSQVTGWKSLGSDDTE